VSKSNIKIDRLDIRLRGVSQQSARTVADGLARELATQVASRAKSSRGERSGDAVDIDAGTSSVQSSAGPSELRALIAGRIADAIASKLGSR
jgi:hypothetical protein